MIIRVNHDSHLIEVQPDPRTRAVVYLTPIEARKRAHWLALAADRATAWVRPIAALLPGDAMPVSAAYHIAGELFMSAALLDEARTLVVGLTDAKPPVPVIAIAL